MEIPLLKEIMIIFILSIIVILLCYKIKLPTIVGFLITGVLAGPHGFGFIEEVYDVEMLANIGIVLLLFSVGMEFSIKKIIEYKRYFFIGGVLQVLLTTIGGFAIGYIADYPMGESIFLGFLLCLSSTAIVLRMLDEKSQTDSPQGRFIIGVLIFQDIVAIPMMLLTPMLSGAEVEIDAGFWWGLTKGMIVLGSVLGAAHYLVPRLLFLIARTRSRELFLLSVLTICFSVAWVTSSVGLSLSLGAFLAGMIVSDSEYRNEAVNEVLPFQDIFTSFFFVSIGMLLDTAFFFQQPFFILGVVAGVILLKTVMASTASIILGTPLRVAVLSGLALSQVGEFSFVLAKNGVDLGMGSNYHYQLFLAVSLLTMAATPTLINISPFLARLCTYLPFPDKIVNGLNPPKDKAKFKYENHIIIVGFGPSGQNLARSLKESKIPYVVVEMNPETVLSQKAKGEPIIYGDATHQTVLTHIDLDSAKAVAVLINDFQATQRIVELVRRLNANVFVIARTRYMQQIKPLYDSGADDVIPDEFGTSVEVFTRVLRTCSIAPEAIEKIAQVIREEGMEMHRLLYKEKTTLTEVKNNP